MTPQNLLLARLDAFATGCDEAEKAINSKGINAQLFNRAAPDLLLRISTQRKKIENQRSRIEKNHIGADSWNLLQTYEADGSTLFGECLAFLQAARARGHDVDGDLCEIADALLDELAGGLANIDWKRFTVLATEEFFLDLAQIIRVRFPCSGIWDLPISAHEFGHFVAGRLNVIRADGSHGLPFQRFKEDFKKQHADRGNEWMFYLEEYFADVFATFALGPAYLCTCLLLRFDPASAHSENDKQHPSYAKRAYAILQTLRRMSMEKDAQGLQTAADALSEFWNEALTAAGKSVIVPEKDFVDGVVLNLYEMLKNGAPLARFNRWENAKKQCPWVEKGELPAEVEAADLKISDLLNAGWLCRLKDGADARSLSNNVIRLCRLRGK